MGIFLKIIDLICFNVESAKAVASDKLWIHIIRFNLNGCLTNPVVKRALKPILESQCAN